LGGTGVGLSVAASFGIHVLIRKVPYKKGIA